MNGLFPYLKFSPFSFSHDIIKMIFPDLHFRSLIMKTEPKTNEIQMLNDI